MTVEQALQGLREQCARLPPPLAESLCRKFVGQWPAQTEGWTLLLRTLLAQHNRPEASRVTTLFLERQGHTPAAVAYAIAAWFQLGEHSQAHRLAQTLPEDTISAHPGLLDIVNQLRLVRGETAIAGHGARAQVAEVRARTSAFNRDFKPSAGGGADVVCYLKHEWHHSIQQGIAEHLREQGVACLFAHDLALALAASPRVLVASDALGPDAIALRMALPGCRLVYTRHGLGDKNYAGHAIGQADFTCVSSEAVAQRLARDAAVATQRIWVTGFPQMDPLFQHLASAPGAPARPCVLVAPTFTEDLHAGPLLGEDLVHRLRGDQTQIRVVIRPHPHWAWTHAALVEAWQQQARALPNVECRLSPSDNVMDLFADASVMVTDVSSTGLAWLATDRPLLCLIDRERARHSAYFAPDGLEWQMQAAATVVGPGEDLRQAVQEAFQRPGRQAAQRAEMRELLFGNWTDGQAARRVACCIQGLLAA